MVRKRWYAIYTRPMIQALSNETANDDVKQMWFADNSSAVGPLEGIKMAGIPTDRGTRLWVLPKTSKNHPHIKRQ